MKMPNIIEGDMFAPCGMNCMVCYMHVGARKNGKRCQGCLNSDAGKPAHCFKCKIKKCAAAKGLSHCYQCAGFPCGHVKNMERSYTRRYGAGIVGNSLKVRELGLACFLEADRERWLCKSCGGAISLHDGLCSECGVVRDD